MDEMHLTRVCGETNDGYAIVDHIYLRFEGDVVVFTAIDAVPEHGSRYMAVGEPETWEESFKEALESLKNFAKVGYTFA